jgi:Mg2+ and Co2+ transporter CorA
MNLLSSGLISGDVYFSSEGVVDATDELLKAMGMTRDELVQLSDTIKDNQDDLIDFGKSALQTAKQNEAIYNTIASTIASTIDTTGMSQEKISQMYNLASGSVYEETYNKVMDTWLDGDADLD